MYRPCGSGLRLGVSSSPWLPSGHITPTSFWFSVSVKKKTYFVSPLPRRASRSRGIHDTFLFFSLTLSVVCMLVRFGWNLSLVPNDADVVGRERESISPEGSSSQRIRGYQSLILLVLMEPEIWERDALLSTATTTTTCCRLDACMIIKPSSFTRY